MELSANSKFQTVQQLKIIPRLSDALRFSLEYFIFFQIWQTPQGFLPQIITYSSFADIFCIFVFCYFLYEDHAAIVRDPLSRYFDDHTFEPTS